MSAARRLVPTEFMGLVLAAFYVGLLLSGTLEKAAAAVTLLLGLWSLREAETRRALAAQTGLFLAFAALPLAAGLSWLVNGMPEDGLNMLGKYARFLLVVPAYAALWRWLRPQALWDALLLTAAIMALWNVAEATWLIDVCLRDECWPYRLNGAINHIQYGGIGFALAAMLLAGMPAYFGHSRKLGLLAAAGASFVLFGAFGAGTRVVYLALLPTLMCWCVLQRWRGTPVWRPAAGALAGAACAASLAWPVINQRTEQALADVEAYQQQDYAKAPSIGGRLLFWRASSEILAEHPWTGAGAFRPAAEARMAPGEFPHGVPSHPHSEYWHAASARGLIGLGALAAALLLPLWRFGRAYSANGSPVAMAGVLMVLAIAQVALTESVFQFSSFNSFYVMTAAAIAALLERERAGAR